MLLWQYPHAAPGGHGSMALCLIFFNINPPHVADLAAGVGVPPHGSRHHVTQDGIPFTVWFFCDVDIYAIDYGWPVTSVDR